MTFARESKILGYLPYVISLAEVPALGAPSLKKET